MYEGKWRCVWRTQLSTKTHVKVRCRAGGSAGRRIESKFHILVHLIICIFEHMLISHVHPKLFRKILDRNSRICSSFWKNWRNQCVQEPGWEWIITVSVMWASWWLVLASTTHELILMWCWLLAVWCPRVLIFIGFGLVSPPHHSLLGRNKLGKSDHGKQPKGKVKYRPTNFTNYDTIKAHKIAVTLESQMQISNFVCRKAL